MNHRTSPITIDWQKCREVVRLYLQRQLKKHGLKIAVLGTLFYMVYQKDLQVDLYLSGAQPGANVHLDELAAPEAIEGAFSEAHPVNVSLLKKAETMKQPTSKPKKRVSQDDNLANTYSNMTYTETGVSNREMTAAHRAKVLKQKAYVQRFAKVAQTEMDKFGIPASIVLAQGLLESNAGDSRLALQNNNHFGVKCFSRSCRKGHCTNFTDDSHKDFFRKYGNAWESYRAHSHLLRANRYLPLYKLGKSDYKSWAIGLKRAGYATDKFYAEKLINLIEELNLHQYDK